MSAWRVQALPLVAGFIVITVFVLLGNWQLRRAAEKAELQVRIEAAEQAEPVALAGVESPAEWLAVTLRGRWRPAATIYLDNRVHRGRAGYHVLTPLQLEDDAGTVLINRGWVAMGPSRRVLPPIATQTGVVQLEAVVRWPETRPFTLAAEAGQEALWQYLDLAAYRQWSDLAVPDWTVQQTSESGDGLVREWPRPDAGVERHHGYAFQWYALAGLALVLMVIFVLRSVKTNHAAQR